MLKSIVSVMRQVMKSGITDAELKCAKLVSSRAFLFRLKIAHPKVGSEPPSNTWFPGPTRVLNPNAILIGCGIFAQLTAKLPYTLQWVAPSPSKLRLPFGRYRPASNVRFLGPTGVLNPNGISIGSAVFEQLTAVTDHATQSVPVGRICLLCVRPTF